MFSKSTLTSLLDEEHISSMLTSHPSDRSAGVLTSGFDGLGGLLLSRVAGSGVARSRVSGSGVARPFLGGALSLLSPAFGIFITSSCYVMSLSD